MNLPDLPILRGPDLRALGVPAPWTFGLADRVRFGEIDALAHVNHTAYLRWFENLRVHWFRDQGLSSYGPNDPRIVLRAINAEYIAEMRLNEAYVITARATAMRTSSFTMDYAVYADGTLRATAGAVIVLLDPQTGEKLPLTQSQRDRLMDDAPRAS